MNKDIIYREDAIKVIKELPEATYEYTDVIHREKAIEKIELIQSAERKGEWIKSETDGFICSACGSGYRDQPTCMGKPMFEYCPVCGAKMKGAEDETD